MFCSQSSLPILQWVSFYRRLWTFQTSLFYWYVGDIPSCFPLSELLQMTYFMSYTHFPEKMISFLLISKPHCKSVLAPFSAWLCPGYGITRKWLLTSRRTDMCVMMPGNGCWRHDPLITEEMMSQLTFLTQNWIILLQFWRQYHQEMATDVTEHW